MNILVINNSNSPITIVSESIEINLLSKLSCIISENNYLLLLRTSKIFKDLLHRGIIVCTPITDNKITYETKQTITTITTTTNNDTIVLNTTNSQISELDTKQSSKNKDTESKVDVSKTNVTTNRKRNKKTRLVEQEEDKNKL